MGVLVSLFRELFQSSCMFVLFTFCEFLILSFFYFSYSLRAKLCAAARNQSGELRIQVPSKYDRAPALPPGEHSHVVVHVL